ncbi:TetR/AcrR family transcriptional regulator [Streptomyces sp. WMMC500]|uniref:TetR/AcrR family transcriptional regulator n=1 Tax=Streptomyces sp. WMMC500 TaxID=3015154 RepID=UPI00248AD609|nr:TetR/AcrR family transcriptional regulator [Streptomyces sp. WMMC500]WBB58707.1 TetR/AcrR family transcriptional regulator [Streptomyces sp. WMMC500]
MDDAENEAARRRVLEAADALFYAHGIRAVRMDRIRDAAGVSLKRLYRCYASKDELVEAYLRRRDRWVRGELADFVAKEATGLPHERVLAVFDWLHWWFGQPGFRGCPFTNAFNEVGAESARAAAAVHDHQRAVRAYLRGLIAATGVPDPDAVTNRFLVLYAGSLTVAAISRSSAPALYARETAATILAAESAPG